MKTNEDIKQARDYGVQAFREGHKGNPTDDKNLQRLLHKDGADTLALFRAWVGGWKSANRAEFI